MYSKSSIQKIAFFEYSKIASVRKHSNIRKFCESAATVSAPTVPFSLESEAVKSVAWKNTLYSEICYKILSPNGFKTKLHS